MAERGERFELQKRNKKSFMHVVKCFCSSLSCLGMVQVQVCTQDLGVRSWLEFVNDEEVEICPSFVAVEYVGVLMNGMRRFNKHAARRELLDFFMQFYGK